MSTHAKRGRRAPAPDDLRALAARIYADYAVTWEPSAAVRDAQPSHNRVRGRAGNALLSLDAVARRVVAVTVVTPATPETTRILLYTLALFSGLAADAVDTWLAERLAAVKDMPGLTARMEDRTPTATVAVSFAKASGFITLRIEPRAVVTGETRGQ